MDIEIGFEGEKRDLNDLLFDLFEQGMLRDGLQNQVAGGATITMRPMLVRKGIAHGAMQIVLTVGDKVAIPLFVSWLYDKWKKWDEPRITVVINKRYYQFDKDILTEALSDELDDEHE